MDYSIIKKLAQERKITLKTLAESVGITEQGFHGYVRKNTMPVNILEAIADKLNVHLATIFQHDLQTEAAPISSDMTTTEKNLNKLIELQQQEIMQLKKRVSELAVFQKPVIKKH